MITRKFDALLTDIREWTPQVKSFDFKIPGGQPFEFIAGQFVMANVLRDGKMVRKPYSIASPPSQKDSLQLIITRVEGGFVSNYFHGMKVGDHLPMDGPYGKFTIKEPHGDLIFVATGTGIAPFRSQIITLFEQGEKNDIWVFFGVRYEDQILYEPEFRALAARHKNFHFVPTISRPRPGQWSGETGYVQAAIKKHIPGPNNKDVYICGIVPMVEDVKKATQEMGFAESQVHYEKYT